MVHRLARVMEDELDLRITGNSTRAEFPAPAS
jgi:hypothetical protein